MMTTSAGSLVSNLLLVAALGLAAGCGRAPAGKEAPPPPAPSEAHSELQPPADAETTASGLTSQLLKPGTGDKHPQLQDKVSVRFSAWNARGKLVDGSEQRGGPQTFEVTGVIAGFREALQRMRVGERRRLWIPDELVYPGRPGFPRAASVFEVELLAILEGEPPRPAPEHLASAPAGAITTRSGLAYQVLHDAAGNEMPSAWDRVTIQYTGWTHEGAMFTRSQHERPAIFDLRGVMPGWREALQRISVGDRVRVWIPEALAYRGRVGKPRGMVVFDIELLSLERRPQPPQAPRELAAPGRGAKRTKSGLAYRILRSGRGPDKAKPSDRVELHYSAWTSHGELFDSSVVRGHPVVVRVDQLIPGWAEGLQLLTEGDEALLWIPERLAYRGEAGAPRGPLVYQVELRRIGSGIPVRTLAQ